MRSGVLGAAFRFRSLGSVLEACPSHSWVRHNELDLQLEPSIGTSLSVSKNRGRFAGYSNTLCNWSAPKGIRASVQKKGIGKPCLSRDDPDTSFFLSVEYSDILNQSHVHFFLSLKIMVPSVSSCI